LNSSSCRTILEFILCVKVHAVTLSVVSERSSHNNPAPFAELQRRWGESVRQMKTLVNNERHRTYISEDKSKQLQSNLLSFFCIFYSFSTVWTQFCLCMYSENKFVTHWFLGLEFAKSDGIKNVDLTYDIQSFTDLGEWTHRASAVVCEN